MWVPEERRSAGGELWQFWERAGRRRRVTMSAGRRVLLRLMI